MRGWSLNSNYWTLLDFNNIMKMDDGHIYITDNIKNLVIRHSILLRSWKLLMKKIIKPVLVRCNRLVLAVKKK